VVYRPSATGNSTSNNLIRWGPTFVGAKPQEGSIVAAKHRMSHPSGQTSTAPAFGVRRIMSGLAGACEIFSASMLCAAAFALLTHAEPDKPSVMAEQGQAPAAQPVRQEGTVVAVTADTVTARSPDGYTQTYRVTPNTALVTESGSQSIAVPSHFAVNDHIAIVGTIRGGTALATEVAERGDGRPMDFGAPGNA
jgi:hypothetical protein